MLGACVPWWFVHLNWRNLIWFLVLNEVRGLIMSGPLWWLYLELTGWL